MFCLPILMEAQMISLIQFPNVQNFASWEAFEIVGSLCLILLTGLAAAFFGFYCAREFKGDKRKTILIFTLIAVLLAVMLLALPQLQSRVLFYPSFSHSFLIRILRQENVRISRIF